MSYWHSRSAIYERNLFFMQEAKRLNIHRTVHAGEAGPAANVKIVSIVKTKVF